MEAQDTYYEIYELAPIEVEFAFSNSEFPVLLNFDEFSNGDSTQILAGLNGSGKTLSIQLIHSFTNLISNPSYPNLKKFQSLAKDIPGTKLKFMSIRFKDMRAKIYEDYLPFGWYHDNTKSDIQAMSNYFRKNFTGEEGLEFETFLSLTYRWSIEDHEEKWEKRLSGLTRFFFQSTWNEFSWFGKWKEIKPPELGSDNRHFIPHLFDSEFDANRIKTETGLCFTHQPNYDDACLDDLEKYTITKVLPSEIVEVKDGYDINQQLLEKFKLRWEMLSELMRIISSGSLENYNSAIDDLCKISDEYPVGFFQLDKLRLVDFSTFDLNDFNSLGFFDKFVYTLERDMYLKYLLKNNNISNIVSKLILLCEGAFFLQPDATDYFTSGQRRLLHLASQLYYSQSGTLLMIDEPELSLHIKWQRNLIKAFEDINNVVDLDNDFLDYFKMTTRVLFATHSPDIIYDHQEKVVHLYALGDGRIE